MTQSQRLGLSRLIVVVLVPWVIGWSVLYFVNQRRAIAAHTEVNEGALCFDAGVDCPPDPWRDAMSEYLRNAGISAVDYDHRKDEKRRIGLNIKEEMARYVMRLALLVGIGAPDFVFIASLAGAWVWRGYNHS